MGAAAEKIAPSPQREWFDIQGASVYTGKKVKTLQKAVERGLLVPDGPTSKTGLKSNQFRRATLDAYMSGSDNGG